MTDGHYAMGDVYFGSNEQLLSYQDAPIRKTPMKTPPPDPCIVTMLRSPARLEPHTCNEAADEIERLRQERDEARRAACKGEAMLRLQRNRVHRDSEEVVCIAKEISVERGWDCFKENS